MIVSTEINQETITYNLNEPIDISLPIKNGKENPNAWFANDVLIEPIKSGGFIGKISEGGSVNSNYITFNPHGNGTHTECVGHITPQLICINEVLIKFHFSAYLITVRPTILKNSIGEFMKEGDWVIMKNDLEKMLGDFTPEALVIRTNSIPESEKSSFNYSGQNAPYLHYETADFIREKGIKHLLIDLPSVDKENDGNLLLSHKSFWNYPKEINLEKTITELIFVPENVKDGPYLLNLQIANFSNNATPSKPILYAKSNCNLK